MADKNTIAQMLEHLVNGDSAKAEELFHEYVVSKSRDIYEELIESEIEDDEEAVDEAAETEDDEAVEENFEDIAYEGDDEEADAGDDMLGDIEGPSEFGDEEGGEGEESLETKVMDLEDAVEELEAKFAELQGEEEEEGHEFGDEEGGEEGGFGSEEDELEDSFQTELATVREYVEKVAGGHGAEKKGAGETQVNAKSIVAGKNDMGGTTANIAKGGEGGGTEKGFVQGAKDLGVNGPKEAAKGAFKSKVTGGHGAEKSGSKESADNKQSLFRK